MLDRDLGDNLDFVSVLSGSFIFSFNQLACDAVIYLQLFVIGYRIDCTLAVCVCCVSSALATRNLGTYVSLLDLESFVGHDWTPGSSQGAEECCRSLLMLSRAAPCILALRSDCIAHLTLVQQEPGLYFVLGIDACCLLDFATLWTWLMAAHVAVHLGIGPLLALSLARAFPWRYAHPALAIPLWYGSTCCMMALAPCARGRFMLWTKNN